MKFSKWIFLGAGVYGLLVTVPLYNETGTAQMFPPSVNPNIITASSAR